MSLFKADPTVDSDMAKDWAEIVARNTIEPEPDIEGAELEVAAAELEGAPAEGEAQPPAVARDPDGKFAKAEADKAAKAAKAAPAKPGVKPAAPVKVQPNAPAAADVAAPPADLANPDAAPAAAPGAPKAIDLNRAPSSWKPAAKAAWAALPEPIRAEIHRRESDFFSGTQQLRPDADLGAGIRKVIEPYRMMIDAEGGNPVAAVADLMRTAAALRMADVNQRANAIITIAQRYGVNLVSLGAHLQRQQGQPNPGNPGQGQPPPSGQARDPRLDVFLQQQEQERQQRDTSERQTIEQTAAAWMQEKDPQGAPIRPYLDNVFDEMKALIPEIKRTNPNLDHRGVLQAAYDRATWANPEVRAVLQQSLDAKRQAENRQKVANARKAAGNNVPRRGSTPNPAKPGTMDETIRETARNLGMIS